MEELAAFMPRAAVGTLETTTKTAFTQPVLELLHESVSTCWRYDVPTFTHIRDRVPLVRSHTKQKLCHSQQTCHCIYLINYLKKIPSAAVLLISHQPLQSMKINYLKRISYSGSCHVVDWLTRETASRKVNRIVM